MGKELQTLALENPLDEILVCQAAEIDTLTQRGDTPEKIVSIQRDILRILEVFCDIVQFAGTVNDVDTVN